MTVDSPPATGEDHPVTREVPPADPDVARLVQLRAEFVRRSEEGANGLELRHLREAITQIEQKMAAETWAQAEAAYQADAAVLAEEYWAAHDACGAALDRLIDACAAFDRRAEDHARDPRREASGVGLTAPPDRLRIGDEPFRAAFRAVRRRPEHPQSPYLGVLVTVMDNWSPPRKDTRNG